MANETQGNWLRQQIYNRMQEKETEELLDIWKRSDRDEWSDDAFEIIHNILLERLGSVPEQGVVTEKAEDESAQDESEEEKMDTYHMPDNLFRISTWANTLAWVILGLSVILLVGTLIIEFQQGAILNWAGVFSLLNSFLTLLVGGFFFVVLRALAEIIYILMDIEDNTRQAVRNQVGGK